MFIAGTTKIKKCPSKCSLFGGSAGGELDIKPLRIIFYKYESMPKVTKKYSDFDLSFLPHPVSGDITVLRDADAVKRAVRNLLFTVQYDRPMEPELGSDLRYQLFEPITPLTEKSIEISIRGAISRYEPRVTIIELQVNGQPDENGYDVSLTFAINALSTVLTINQFLEKIR